MYDYVIIHGAFGNPFENWIPWLFSQLTENGKKVLVPQFPTPENQSYAQWEGIMNSYSPFI